MRNLFTAGTDDHRLLYIDKRLKSRRTFCEYDKQMMGPILDTKGVEQGGIASSDKYKLYNNEQGTSAQNSNLGVTLRGITITSITDFIAFGIGASTILPALRSFCMFAAVGILSIFVFQVR